MSLSAIPGKRVSPERFTSALGGPTMETIETFVTSSIHISPKGNKFIRARFQVDGQTYLTAFNPKGVASVEWVQRISRTTGKQRIQSRFPVRVSFKRSSVVGSDVVESCIISPRDFTPTEMAAADAGDLEALTNATAPTATVAVQQVAEEPLA